MVALFLAVVQECLIVAIYQVPGMREFAMSDSNIRRLFWLVSFVCLGALCLMDISVLMADFYGYPITVDVRVKESRKLQFPAVTVCNLNVLRWSALCNSSTALNVTIPPELKERLCGFQVQSEVRHSNVFRSNVHGLMFAALADRCH